MNAPTQYTESSRKREPPTTEAEALSRLSPELVAIVEEFRAAGLTFNAWVANDRLYGIKGGHLDDLQRRLLAGGWGQYSATCLVSWNTL